ncbi:MAG: hypothetical protein J6Q38_06520 [Clostridia bacterium]|nr:hypothetical protein [Clostridia bacterium]
MSKDKEKIKEIHAAHRERLRRKFVSGKESFEEHELLELLLTYSIPRKDTNALAHELIDKFGSLKNVLQASPELLRSVNGVGDNSACFLSLINYVSNVINKPSLEKKQLSTIAEAKKNLPEVFKDYDHEVLFIIYLNKFDKILNTTLIDNNSESSVLVDFTEITKGILLNKPHSIVVAHNHFSKFPKPSEADDFATEKLYVLLNLYKVNFYDHLIISGNEVYSYFYDNRLQKIKERVDSMF